MDSKYCILSVVGLNDTLLLHIPEVKVPRSEDLSFKQAVPLLFPDYRHAYLGVKSHPDTWSLLSNKLT